MIFNKNLKLKINNLLVCLFLFLLPTQLGKHFFFDFSYLSGVRVDYLAPTIYLIDLVAIFLLLFNHKIIFHFFWNKKFLFLLAIILINFFISQSRFISLYQYLKIFEFLSVFIIFKKTGLAAKHFLLPITLAGIIQLILVVGQFVTKHSLQGIFYYLGERYFNLSTPSIAKATFQGVEILRPYGSFSHPNSLAGFYLLLYAFVITSKKFFRLIWLKKVFLFVSSLLVLISFSKVAIVSFLILNTSYFMLNTGGGCRLCRFAKTSAFFILSLIFLQVRSDPLSLEKRLSLIKNSFQLLHQNLFFGVGAGSYLVVQNKLTQTYANFLNQPVHNIFLLFMVEWGLIITGIFIYLLLPVLKQLNKKNLWIFLVILITGFFDHYWLSLNQNFLLMAVVFAVL